MTRFDETGNEFAGDDVREVTARSIGPRRKGLKISGPGAAACFRRGLLRDEAREPFLALYLNNGARHIVSLSLVSVGSAPSAPVSPRELFPGALLVGACDLRVGPNHPSRDLHPSAEDVTVTRQLKEAGELLRVPVLDHVLFSDTFWHWRTPEEMAKLQAHGKAAAPAPCYPFVVFVFNLDQTEGIERPADDVQAAKNYPLEEAQKIVAEMPNRPKIRHGASLNPCYKPAIDVVEMPTMGQFEDAERYFCVLYHELCHATGAPSRLNRFEKREGESREERYGFEELVAELGAAFLSATCGLDNSSRLDDASAYLAGWLKALRDDRKLLLQAASAAQKAADYILGKTEELAEEGRTAA